MDSVQKPRVGTRPTRCLNLTLTSRKPRGFLLCRTTSASTHDTGSPGGLARRIHTLRTKTFYRPTHSQPPPSQPLKNDTFQRREKHYKPACPLRTTRPMGGSYDSQKFLTDSQTGIRIKPSQVVKIQFFLCARFSNPLLSRQTSPKPFRNPQIPTFFCKVSFNDFTEIVLQTHGHPRRLFHPRIINPSFATAVLPISARG